MNALAQDVNPAPGDYACVACGACCAAPDISTLAKPLGVTCKHQGAGEGPTQVHRCTIYDTRPAVCRGYTPDWICAEVAPLPTLAARVRRYLEIFGLEAAAAGAPEGVE